MGERDERETRIARISRRRRFAEENEENEGKSDRIMKDRIIGIHRWTQILNRGNREKFETKFTTKVRKSGSLNLEGNC